MIRDGMSLNDYKIQPEQIAAKGVIAAPDKLTGTAAENKAVFDRLIREVVAQAVNGLVDGLTARTGASEVGAAVEGIDGTDVQALLNGLKQYIDESVINAGAMVSFNDRNGRVFPQTGDYTADQITETGRRFITNGKVKGDLEVEGSLKVNQLGSPLSVANGGTGRSTGLGARENLGIAKLLWEGWWSEGSITVGEIRNYTTYLLCIGRDGGHSGNSILANRVTTDIRGIGGTNSGNAQFITTFGCKIGGTTLSSPSCKSITHVSGKEHLEETPYGVYQIYGVV